MRNSILRNCLFAVFCTLLIFNASGQTSVPGISFSFILSTSSNTSAGVFKPDGTLIKTLWSGVSYSAGFHSGSWDGKDDYGNYVADDNYQVKVLSNNVNYQWEGVVGNTSQNFSGNSVYHSYHM